MKTAPACHGFRSQLFLISAPALIFVFAASGQTPATMLDIGPTAPTPGLYDIAQLSTNGESQTPGGLNYFTDNGANHGFYAGQTFTTGGNALGYVLNSVSIFTSGLNQGGHYDNSQLYHLYIYSVTGSVATGDEATLLDSFTSTASFTGGDWLQWTDLGTVRLAPDTVYAYSFGRDKSGEGWASLGNANQIPAYYPDGALVMIGPDGGVVNFAGAGWDATFNLGLTAVPEPSALAMAGLGFAGMMFLVWGRQKGSAIRRKP